MDDNDDDDDDNLIFVDGVAVVVIFAE